MARKKKSVAILDSVYDIGGGIDSELNTEFRSDDYSSADDRIAFRDADDKFNYLLRFSECVREYTKVDINGQQKNVKPLGKMKSGKYILITNKNEKMIVKPEDIKLI